MTGPAAAVRPSSLHERRRDRELEQLAAGMVVDLVVIGGGVTGTSVALDAATRGLSVALVEARDLAFGTSRWSSKLVHGGLRYLASGQLGLAAESARERGILLERTAPHLVRSLAMLVPAGIGSTLGEAALAGLGTAVADLLRIAAGTRRATLPHPRWIGPAEARLLAPGLTGDDLRGAVLYWDGQLGDDARLVVALGRTAAAFGARVLTGCEVTEAAGDGVRLRVTTLRGPTRGPNGDRVSGPAAEHLDVRARAVVNATGVWAQRLHPEVRLRPSRGAHLLLRPEAVGSPIAGVTLPVAEASGSRFVFLLPQPEGPVLVGLTDEPVTAISDVPEVTADDEDFLLRAVRRAFGADVGPADVVGRFAGLRPLLDAEGAEGVRSADLSRAHRLLARPDGLVTIVGGKLTTARRMAADVVDHVVAREGWSVGPCVTARQPLVGAASRARLARLAAPPWRIARYGTEAPELTAWVASEPELATPVAPGTPLQLVDLVWAVAHEGGRSVDDLLDRRTRLGLQPALRAAAQPAAEAALAWPRG